MRNKRLLAVSMALLLALQSPLASMSVNAIEIDAQPSDVTEYVVQVDNNKEFEEVVEDNEEVVVEDESVAELEEENIVVLELTDEEAAELEEDKNIVVEENILFFANTMDNSEAVAEEMEASTTEAVAENTEEASTENVTEATEQATQDIASEEAVTQETMAEEQTTESVTAEPTTKKAGKNKKEKTNKKDKSKKEKEDKEEKAEKRAKIESKKNKVSSETEQWNLDAIHYTSDVEKNSAIKVAILDSGVSFDEDVPVVERITINENNEVENALFDDATGHETSMAGIIAAQDNEDGIKGINPDADIYSIQILDENNQSTLGQVIAGIHKAIELDCDIINMSFGTTVDSQLLHDAIKEADKNGILMIAAAGNTEGGAVEYPAAYDEVLAVGATDTTGNKLDGSSDGAEIEIFAPGDQVISTGLFGGNVVLSGTSIAAAQVTGAASVLWSMDKDKSAGFIRSLMTNTAQTMEDNGASEAGLLDMENAVAQYNTLEYTYEESTSEYEELQEEVREAEEFLDVKLVNGMWGGGKHANMADAATVDYVIDTSYIQLMKRASQLADDDKYKKAGRLHGKKNYVQTLKFLYNCAQYLRGGKSVANSISKAGKDAGISETSELAKKVKLLLETNILPNISEKSGEARYFKVMGFAIHVAGDTYAHRIIVPTYTMKGTNPLQKIESASTTAEASRFGSNDFSKASHSGESNATLKTWALECTEDDKIKTCRNWNCFQKTVRLGVVEFRDIKHFSLTSVGADAYEDNENFCRERYEEAEYVCWNMFTESYDGYKFDGIYILFPTEKNLKLNNFKNYAKAIGEDTSIFTAKEWAEMSTPTEY